MITGVFVTADSNRLAYEVDGGDGGVFVIDPTVIIPPEEVDGLDNTWIRLGPGGAR